MHNTPLRELGVHTTGEIIYYIIILLLLLLLFFIIIYYDEVCYGEIIYT